MGKLSAKQEMFCREYLVDLNATQAAIRAGYSEKSAYNQGARMMKNDEVLTRVKDLREERMQQLGLDAYWVLKRLKEINDQCMRAVPVEKWDYEEKRMVETGEFVFDSQGANRSAELIGKHLGMFGDKLKMEVSGQVTQTNEQKTHIIHEIISDPDIAARIRNNYRRRIGEESRSP